MNTVDYWVLLIQWEVVAGVTTWYGYAAGVVTAETVTVASPTVLSLTSGVIPELAGTALGVTSTILFVTGARRGELIQRMRRVWTRDRSAGVLVGVGWVVVVALISVLFQVDLDASRRFVNVVAHGAGFVTGMLVMVGVVSWK